MGYFPGFMMDDGYAIYFMCLHPTSMSILLMVILQLDISLDLVYLFVHQGTFMKPGHKSHSKNTVQSSKSTHFIFSTKDFDL